MCLEMSVSSPTGLLRRRRRQRGSAFLEFSLVFLPLVAFILMTMDLAWILFAWASIQEGVREGVRYGVALPVSSNLDNSIRTIVQQCSMGFVPLSNATSTSNNSNSIIKINYYLPIGMTNVTGTSEAIQGGNVIQVSISSITVGTFGPLFRNWKPIQLSAVSADVLPTCSPNCPTE